jgi:hypothetical protein
MCVMLTFTISLSLILCSLSCLFLPLFMTCMLCNSMRALLSNFAFHGFDTLWNTPLGKYYNGISVRLRIRLWSLELPMVIPGTIASNT